MAALATLFNFLALNLVLLVVSLPILTLPLALNAVVVALDRWRGDGEDRVVREFVVALRTWPVRRTTLAVGTPMAAAVVAAEEVHFFARGGGVVTWVCLGCGVAALVIALTTLGYVLVLVARRPSLSLPDLWSLCIGLAVRNLFLTGALAIADVAGAVLATLLDPSLLLLGLPLTMVLFLRLTAKLGLRKVGFALMGDDRS
jgi:hypothetical protein